MCVMAKVEGALQGSTSEVVAVTLERLRERLTVADDGRSGIAEAWNATVARLPGQREM